MIVLDELGAQAQPGDRGAQVVADRRQHLRAVVDRAAHPSAHPVQSARHREHLPGTGFRQRDVVVAGAEGLRRAGRGAPGGAVSARAAQAQSSARVSARKTAV